MDKSSSDGGKLTKGRRKIDMKKIEKKSQLHVTFSKRRTGLFKKAAELHLLCGAEVAIFVQSPAKRVFVFGSSPPDSVIRWYLDGVNGRATFRPNPLPQHHHVGVAGELEGKGSHGNSGGCDWLEEALRVDLFDEELSLEEAEKYLATQETPLPQYGYLGAIRETSFCPNPVPQYDHKYVEVAGKLEGKANKIANQDFVEASGSCSHGNSDDGGWLEEELGVDLELSLEEAEKYLDTTETPLPQYGYLDGANRETSFCPNPLPQYDHKYVEVAGRLDGQANETVNQGFVKATGSCSHSNGGGVFAGKLEGQANTILYQDSAEASGSGNSSGGVSWFDEEVNVQELGLEEAERYLAALETLRNNVLNRANDLKMARAFM